MVQQDKLTYSQIIAKWIDEQTEEELKAYYFSNYKGLYEVLKQTSELFNCPIAQENKTLESKLHKQWIVKGSVNIFKQSDHMYKRLTEMKIHDSDMILISWLHAHITTKMIELKEVAEGPEWNPALHHSSK